MAVAVAVPVAVPVPVPVPVPVLGTVVPTAQRPIPAGFVSRRKSGLRGGR